MLSGVVRVGDRDWEVREEKRQGPRKQILILTAVRSPGSEMHIRPFESEEATTLEEVEALATDPLYRWFKDENDVRWEARIVVHSEPDVPDVELVKFISEAGDVCEGDYGYAYGLGVPSDEELRELLQRAKGPLP